MEEDYRLYLDEKFKGLYDAMKNGFELQNKDIQFIKDQTLKTNGRVTKLEEFKDIAAKVIETRSNDCPLRDEVKVIEDKVNLIEKESYSKNQIKKFVIATVSVVGTIVGVITAIFKLL